MKKMTLLALAFLLAAMIPGASLHAQDLAYYKQIVKELSSAKYQGRGYAYGGANKAGTYLLGEFAKAGANELWRQEFTIDINTFPGKMKMSVDGKGRYVVSNIGKVAAVGVMLDLGKNADKAVPLLSGGAILPE